MSTREIRIILAGPRGKMGSAARQLIANTAHFQLVAYLDRKQESETGFSDGQVQVYTDVEQCLSEVEADVFIDLTTPDAAKINLEKALDHHVRPVIGTTGFSEAEIERLRQKSEDKSLGVMIVPNFAIGAVLMMKFSQMAARYFDDVEIIERHHDRKLDAPSGTALKTANMISEVRSEKAQGHPEETETLEGARGGNVDGMPIHSVRLPGLVAHQEVVFGGSGQTLTIRHDSIDRGSFMPGVKLAVETVINAKTLIYGLEQIME
ncbi:4-hydroxy-tetrahydrodipicolinate reductase [Geomicrobium halophilum]|uniref:4-hydroxy-tetrahydrodipicolinate reductase n=1 Tax=Geomicrobium halophilum TaxID=549000 RepID=A0A841PK02_9BACL|nr:4-hydroxy-tetrahydrodipicolinate reductase [Geomicrobium halophilum]MBB6449059.1 4-hydroxy-tetrahydrodipicolinate reductase [Geomicrobium halophilum]